MAPCVDPLTANDHPWIAAHGSAASELGGISVSLGWLAGLSRVRPCLSRNATSMCYGIKQQCYLKEVEVLSQAAGQKRRAARLPTSLFWKLSQDRGVNGRVLYEEHLVHSI